MNVVPGLPTKFSFTPTLTTNEMRSKLENANFDYILLCNKICGRAHYRMKMKVIVDSQEEFEKWLKTQPALTAKGFETNNKHSFFEKSTPLASK
jgi:cytochrome c oxidase subunit 2